MSGPTVNCEVCGRSVLQADPARCLDCGRLCCRQCKGAGYHLCNGCWNTADRIAADRAEAGRETPCS